MRRVLHEFVSLQKLETSRNVTSKVISSRIKAKKSKVISNRIKAKKSKSTEQYDSASISFASTADVTLNGRII